MSLTRSYDTSNNDNDSDNYGDNGNDNDNDNDYDNNNNTKYLFIHNQLMSYCSRHCCLC